MVTPTPEQIARLPKWAQRERNALLQDNAQLRRSLADKSDGPENLIYADPWAATITAGDKPRPVGTVNTRIEYFLTPDKDRFETVTVNIEKSGQLAIAATHRSLRIEPRATNLAYVTLAR